MCVSLSLSLSLSLSYNNAPKCIGRDVLRERKRAFAVKSYNCSRNICQTPPPSYLSAGISSRQNFIRAGFLYKFITLEGTSHLLSVSVCVVGVLGMVEHFHSRFTNFVTHPPAPQPSRPTHIPPVVGSFSSFVYRFINS